MCGAALALCARAFWLEPRSLRVVQYDLAVPHWPAGCRGIRVAVLSDLHVGSPFNGIDKLRRVVALTRDAAPDLVLLTGDYVIQGVRGGSFVAPEAIAPELGRVLVG